MGFHGGKVEMERPRVRSKTTGKELPLPSWKEAAEVGWLEQWAMSLMLMNVATRKVGRAVRLPDAGVPCEAGSGLSKSAVSRRFKALTQARLEDWMASDLSALDLLVIQSGSLGILIPPSIPLIIYASLASVSPAQLFIAGLLPGLLIAALLAVWAMLAAPPPANIDAAAWSLRHALRVTLRALPDLALPVVVLGGIYLGIYTPTEAAGVGVVLALLLTVVLRRSLGLRELPEVMISAALHSAGLLAIVIGALVLGSALTLIGLPQFLAKQIMETGVAPWVALLIMNLVWVLLGCFLEVMSIILITVPVFVPVAVALGFDPLWFGILMVINMELAVITPPLGMNLFALKAILPDERLETIIRAAMPSLAIVLIVLALVWVFPDIALVLTRL